MGRVVSFSFLFFFFFRASEIPELITLFLILVSSFFYLGTFEWRVDERGKGMKNVGLGYDEDKGQTKGQVGWVPFLTSLFPFQALIQSSFYSISNIPRLTASMEAPVFTRHGQSFFSELNVSSCKDNLSEVF